ncbi:sensor histidine kinase [Antricoccus suffuscus]|nr:ATP-binding protein [Antricoccus suffuscus]
MRMRARMRRWGVRKRATLVAASVVLVALLGGGALLLVFLQQALINDATNSASTTAKDIASRYDNQEISPTDSLPKDLRHKGLEIQIVRADGVVVAAGHAEYRTRSLVSTLAPPGKTVTYPADSAQISEHEDPSIVTSVGFVNHGMDYAVNVQADVDVQTASVRTAGLYLLVGFPVLVGLVAAVTWFLVGRALREVERIREQVDGVRRASLSQRIGVPRTADEIARLAQTMNEMLARLEESDAAQRRFAADASHELRSPLATLGATLEIAIADTSGQTWRDMQPVLTSQTERMKDLVDDLLVLAKADDRGVQIRRTEQDLDDIVETEVGRIRGASVHTIVVRAVPIRLHCDGPRIEQVISNLLDNAGRHAMSRIWVTVAADGTTAVVDIDNDGPVVPVDERTRIFERFVRLDDSRSRGSGNSGLGLAIATEYTRAHGGTLTATESPEGYCRFRLTLPID